MKIKDVVEAINNLAKEKNIPAETIRDLIVNGLVKAYRRESGIDEELMITNFDLEKHTLTMFIQHEVIEDEQTINDEIPQLNLKDALALNPYAQVGSFVNVPVDLDELGRMAALTAKQVIIQKIREEERNMVQAKYQKLIGNLIEVEVVGEKENFYFVRIDNVDAILLKKETNPSEHFKIGDKILVYLSQIEKLSKGLKLFMSRNNNEFLIKLLELRIPEVRDGLVEIKGVARYPGLKAKVAVRSCDENIDPVGSIVGTEATRVKGLVKELAGDEIEVVLYDEEPLKYIANILKPVEIIEIFENDETQEALVVVPDDQISLAIGSNGHNVKLSVRLSNWRIDVKTESEAEELGLL